MRITPEADATIATFYKATRLDGLSFHDSPNGRRPRYLPGDVVSVPKDRRMPMLCSSGVIHASDVPHGTLAGGQWPCRLFEVEGASVIGPDVDRKHGFYTLRSVCELPAYLAFGPNGAQVAAYLSLIRTLTPAQWDAAARPWVLRKRLRTGVSGIFSIRSPSTARIESRMIAWEEAYASACRDTAGAPPLYSGALGGTLAAALVCRDLIPSDDFTSIYDPMQSVLPIERVEEAAKALVASEVHRGA